MINYNKGKIYKIESINGAEGEIYIGSTTKDYLSQRMTTHRGSYNSFKNGKSPFITSYLLFDKYGVENCKIILLETVNVNSKDELLSREAHYIKKLDCVNKQIPLRTRKEYSKEYYQENKEHITEWQKDYYIKNKDYITERVCCPHCDTPYSRSSKSKHNITKKHKHYILTDSTDDESS